MQMGDQTDSGHWKNPYRVQFPFTTYDARHFFFGHNLNNNHWFIQELLPDGKMGQETDNGQWNHPYEVMFPFTIKGRTFCFGHNLNNNYWFIQELLPDGKMGPEETSSGYWKNPYATLVPYWVENRLFFFGHNTDSKYWFIQELLPGGKLGQETDHGGWNTTCNVAFPFQAAAKTYIFFHDTGRKSTTIREFLPGGKRGYETDDKVWKNPYGAMFPYNIGGDQYCYGQNLNNNHWFIQELLPGGKLGQETANGHWKFTYQVQFPFEIAGRQFFYGNSLNTGPFTSVYHWFIQELLGDLEPDTAGSGEAQTDPSSAWARVYIWSYRGVLEAVGHASLKLWDGTYISWWPDEETPWTLARVANGFKKPARNPQTYADDVRLEGFKPDRVITIQNRRGGLDTLAISDWWTRFRGNPDNMYHLLTQNCATTVKDALVAGGAWSILGRDAAQPFKDISIWVPADHESFAAVLRGKTGGLRGQDGSTGSTPSRQDRGEAGPGARPAMT